MHTARRTLMHWFKVTLIWLILILTGLEILAQLTLNRPVPVVMAVEIGGEMYRQIFPQGLFVTEIELARNFSGIAPTGIEYATNEYGLRDDPIDHSKRLWLFLGDSTTFGLHLTHEQTYTEIVEASVPGIQTVNAAVVDWCPIEQAAMLDTLYADGLHFEWVVIGFFGNDPANTVRHLASQRHETILNVSALYRMVTEINRQQRIEAVYAQDWRGMLREPDLWSHTEWQTMRPYFDRIVTTARAHGAQVALLHIPLDEIEILEHSYIDDALREYAHDQEIGYISGVDVYRAYLADNGLTTIPDTFYSVPGDMGHPSALTSRLLAEAITMRLTE